MPDDGKHNKSRISDKIEQVFNTPGVLLKEMRLDFPNILIGILGRDCITAHNEEEEGNCIGTTLKDQDIVTLP